MGDTKGEKGDEGRGLTMRCGETLDLFGGGFVITCNLVFLSVA
jgi:hypothetical protein